MTVACIGRGTCRTHVDVDVGRGDDAAGEGVSRVHRVRISGNARIMWEERHRDNLFPCKRGPWIRFCVLFYLVSPDL